MEVLVGIVVNLHNGLVEVDVIGDLVTIVVISDVIGGVGMICLEDVDDNLDGALDSSDAQNNEVGRKRQDQEQSL